MSNKLSPRKVMVAFAASASVLLGGCSMLNSQEQSNAGVFTGLPDVTAKADSIQKGMSKAEVLKILGVALPSPALVQMDNVQISQAMYGGAQVIVPFDKKEEMQSHFESLKGFRLHIRDVDTNKRFGLTHTQKKSQGFDVSYTFVFKDDRLVFKSEPAGGPVREKSRDGYLNSLTPGDAVNKIL